MKIRRLEAEVGQPLLVRLGRGVAPTAAGRELAAHAREMLRLNDAAWGSLSSNRLSGQVRLGVPDDHAAQLAGTIRAFRLRHPEVTLDISCAFSVELLRQVQEGRIDLAVVTRMPSVPGGDVLRREPMLWVAAPGFRPEEGAPLPLSVYPEQVCVLRSSMTEALSAAGIPWRIAYTSMSLTGQTAMVGVGLAMTALTRSMLQQAAGSIGPCALPDLPDLPEIEIALHRRPGRPTDAARLLGDMLKERFRAADGA
jgi:DNA-binding transcriptional LysR family regulator